MLLPRLLQAGLLGRERGGRLRFVVRRAGAVHRRDDYRQTLVALGALVLPPLPDLDHLGRHRLQLPGLLPRAQRPRRARRRDARGRYGGQAPAAYDSGPVMAKMAPAGPPLAPQPVVYQPPSCSSPSRPPWSPAPWSPAPSCRRRSSGPPRRKKSVVALLSNVLCLLALPSYLAAAATASARLRPPRWLRDRTAPRRGGSRPRNLPSRWRSGGRRGIAARRGNWRPGALFDVGILPTRGTQRSVSRAAPRRLLGLELALGLEHPVLGPVEHRVDVVLRLRAQRELPPPRRAGAPLLLS